MTSSHIDRTIGARAVPAGTRALSSIPGADYGDLFTLATDTEATPERWARAMFGDVPRGGELIIWRGLLGLRLTRERSPDAVAGWRIASRGGRWIRMEATSWLLSGNLLIQTSGGQVSLATFVRYDHWLARVWWPPLSAIHRRLVPRVLRSAAARVAVSPQRA